MGGLVIAGAAFDTDRPLRNGRQHFFRRKRRCNLVSKTHTGEARHRKEGCVRNTLAELSKPRIDIAAEGHHFEVGAPRPQLRGAAERGGANARACGHVGERACGQRNKGVARIGALEQTIDDKPVGQHGRHVLHRVDGNVDPRIGQLLLDFLRKEPLAADFRQGPVLDPVARRADDDDLRHLLDRRVARKRDTAGNLVCLYQGELRSSCADAVAALHAGSLRLYASGSSRAADGRRGSL